MAKKNTTQSEIIMEYFVKNQNRPIPHPEIVDWAVDEYLKRAGKVFRDPDRQIRKLHQEGKLVKVSKGIYKYDPKMIKHRKLEDFTLEQKQKIFVKDGFKCVMCGKGKKDGVELQVDHIKPKDKGGKATVLNGQTLCAAHNFKKKNYNQTETGKTMFIRIYEIAKQVKDTETVDFCKDILKTFDKHGINGHIEWKE